MKFILLGVLVFLFYRLVSKPKQIEIPTNKDSLQESEKEGFVDYEELE